MLFYRNLSYQSVLTNSLNVEEANTVISLQASGLVPLQQLKWCLRICLFFLMNTISLQRLLLLMMARVLYILSSLRLLASPLSISSQSRQLILWIRTWIWQRDNLLWSRLSTRVQLVRSLLAPLLQNVPINQSK